MKKRPVNAEFLDELMAIVDAELEKRGHSLTRLEIAELMSDTFQKLRQTSKENEANDETQKHLSEQNQNFSSSNED